MKAWLAELRTSLLAVVVLAVLAVRPLSRWPSGSLARRSFPAKANGSLVVRDGAIVGSRLIAPAHSPAPAYFHPRPSAAGNGYDASASGGSNLGPPVQGR